MKTDEAAVTDDVTAAINDYAPAHLPVVKGISVECVGSEAPQVVRVLAGDLRADLGVVSFRGSGVDIETQYIADIHQSSHFQRSDAVVCAVG